MGVVHLSHLPDTCSETELEFHTLKYFLTSYSPSTHFLALRSIWGFWNWFQMIPHDWKHWFCHQNHVSSMLRSWIWSTSWPPTSRPHSSWPSGQSEASEIGSKWFLMPQNISFATKFKTLACLEADLIHRGPLCPYALEPNFAQLSEGFQLFATPWSPKQA